MHEEREREESAAEPFLPILYVDRSKESQEAEAVLRGAGIRFETTFIPDPKTAGSIVPRLWAKQGIFPGLDVIRWYARAFVHVA